MEKQPQCPSVDEWLKVGYTYAMEEILGYKKIRNPTFHSNMDVTEVAEEVKYIRMRKLPFDFIHLW